MLAHAIPLFAAVGDSKTDFFTKLARRIEPEPAGRADRLDLYVDFFRREMVNDTRLFAFHVDAGQPANTDRVVLSGYSEFQETHHALLQFLACLGFDRITDRIEDLPAKGLGARQFGFIRTTHGFSFDRPDGTQEVVTDCLLGEPLYLLRSTSSGYLLCHSGDGYVGYVRSSDVLRVTATEFTEYQAGEQAHMLRDVPGPHGMLPVGARLKCTGMQDGRAHLRLPTGEHVKVAAAACQRTDGRAAPPVERVIGVAKQFLKTPYLWGGKTSKGIDCSGLVQTAFAAEGIHLPRDASQQVYLGRLTATRWQRRTMLPGDTLYFVGRYGKIRHTALYLGGGKYIEAAGGQVRISSLLPNDGGFDRQRSGAFVFAKRLFD